MSASIGRLGVFGGTFDPIHMGHLIAAVEAAHAFKLDRVLFVPAGQPWQKAGYSDAEDRYAMTVLAAAEHECFAVSRIEIDRRGPTYTVDTLSELRDFHGDACALYFSAGTDAVRGLASWQDIGRIASLAEVVAVARPGSEAIIEPGRGWPRVHSLAIPGLEISATDIRARVRSGAPIDFLVPSAVADYIAERGLYLGAGEERGA